MKVGDLEICINDIVIKHDELSLRDFKRNGYMDSVRNIRDLFPRNVGNVMGDAHAVLGQLLENVGKCYLRNGLATLGWKKLTVRVSPEEGVVNEYSIDRSTDWSKCTIELDV